MSYTVSIFQRFLTWKKFQFFSKKTQFLVVLFCNYFSEKTHFLVVLFCNYYNQFRLKSDWDLWNKSDLIELRDKYCFFSFESWFSFFTNTVYFIKFCTSLFRSDSVFSIFHSIMRIVELKKIQTVKTELSIEKIAAPTFEFQLRFNRTKFIKNCFI